MPKKVFKIPGFDKGIIGNASPRDIPEDALSYGENVDSRIQGRIKGIPGNTTENASFDARVFEALLGDTNELVGQDDDGQFKAYDIDGDSVENVGSSQSNYAQTMVPFNDEVYCGMTSSFRSGITRTPKWVGRINHHQFFYQDSASDLDGSINDSQTTIDVDDIGDIEVGSYIMTDPLDDSNPAEIMKVTAINSLELTVERGVSYTEASAHDSGVTVSTVLVADPSYTVEDAELADEDGTGLLTADGFGEPSAPSFGDGYFVTTKEYFYAFSFVYDGFQESSLIKTDGSGNYFSYNPNNDASWLFMDVNIQFGSLSDFSRRITDINVYRAEAEGNTTEPNTKYRYVDTIPVFLDLTTTLDGSTNGWERTVDDTFSYEWRLLDFGEQGATYEDNTGVPETLGRAHVDYAINEEYGAYMFVGACDNSRIADAEKFIFRSKPKTFSIIDWSRDFVKLNEKPTAMAGFNGRLYVFTKNNMYRINPHTMNLEDSYRGVGALNENMVVTTNYGLFHADSNNIYINDGRTSTPIATPILTVQQSSDDYGWQEMNKTSGSNYASLAFDSENRRLLVFGNASGSTNICWAFDVERRRWDLYPDFDIPSDTTIGVNGKVYATTGNTIDGFELESLFSSATRKNWKIITKDFDLGSDSGDFWAYDLHGYGSGNFTIKYLKDGSSSATNPGTSTEDGLRKATVNSSDKKMKSIALQVESAAVTDELDNMTIQFRPPVIQE